MDSARWDRFVGVIDLKRGKAVHAIAGQRDRYLPTKRFVRPDGKTVSINGDAALLARQYCHLGIGAIYVADLEAIVGGMPQDRAIGEIIDAAGNEVAFRIDAGLGQGDDRLKAQRLAVLLSDVADWKVFVATEAANDVAVLESLTAVLGRTHVGVSLDFSAGRWLSERTQLTDWIAQIKTLDIEAVVALDLQAVGGGDPQRTIDLVERVRAELPRVRLISGGGVRTESDARRLRDAGVDEVMVASLFTGDGSPFAASD